MVALRPKSFYIQVLPLRAQKKLVSNVVPSDKLILFVMRV